jgi:hypothetical protein
LRWTRRDGRVVRSVKRFVCHCLTKFGKGPIVSDVKSRGRFGCGLRESE